MFARCADAEFGVESLQEVFLRLLPDPEGPVALDIGMSAHGAGSGPGFAEVALQEEQVDDLLDRVDGVGLLGDAEGPAEDGCLRRREQLGDVFDLCAFEAGGEFDLGPVEVLASVRVVGEAIGGGFDELAVDDGPGSFCFLLQKQVAEGLEQCLVSAHADLQELVAGALSVGEQAFGSLRILEPEQAGFGKRIDRDHFAAVATTFGEGAEHARMVRPRILTDHEDELGLLEVFE